MKDAMRPCAPLTPPATAAADCPPRRFARLRALLLALAGVAAVLVIGALLNLPARAAAVLEYFNAIPSSSAVLLEWSTTSEYNVAGFEVLCKGVNEPRSAYHRISFLNAKGGPQQGAQYDLLVTDLQPGAAYCFRLQEVTTDDTPGEARERCGYGLSITPTPTLSVTVALTSSTAVTPTIVLFPTPVGQDGLVPTATFPPTLPPGFATNTPDPFLQQSPLETPTPTWTLVPGQSSSIQDPTAAGAVGEGGAAPTFDPLATPTFDPFLATPTFDPFATPTLDPLLATPTLDPLLATPTLDPFAQQPLSPLETPTPTWTPALTATGVLTQAVFPDPAAGAPIALVPTATSPAGVPDGGAPAVDPALVAQPTPTSLYVVVTAAPTPDGQGIAPGLTPWPTATPPNTFQLTNLLTPSAQNLTVLLLCFIFLSATGLGFLGLLTSIVYMRSRAQREYDDLRLRTRRRLP